MNEMNSCKSLNSMKYEKTITINDKRFCSRNNKTLCSQLNIYILTDYILRLIRNIKSSLKKMILIVS